ncbi:hypothetical protein EL22_24300 [Halostagnicola sp. A56]|uniref:CPBP family intramembrane glutamic endopeptidase n=1 Tax=Halostagnicola sp. A56 TaxID=1495067 RepID=UPI0004A0058F|nr:CPBP family intramembrane glutamic endopeptidase [Halostagnicola sp. A56]KDE59197.1 hypothetical protein EL22_24300 [Halostagnicola sp. A56]
MAPPTRSESPARSVLVGFGLAAFAIVFVNLLVAPLAVLEPALAEQGQSADRGLTILLLVVNFGGFFLAGGIYLALTDRGWSFVDLRIPTFDDWAWAIAATLGSILFIVVFGFLIQFLELPQSSNEVVSLVGDDRILLLAMFAIVVFANAPAEEFFFRNIVQKRLYESLSRDGAVLTASLIFALVHIPSYVASGSLSGMFVSLTAVFCGSLIFGYAYARTDNVLVPTVAHAGFNLFQFGLLYLQLEYADSGELPSLLLETAVALFPL